MNLAWVFLNVISTISVRHLERNHNLIYARTHTYMHCWHTHNSTNTILNEFHTPLFSSEMARVWFYHDSKCILHASSVKYNVMHVVHHFFFLASFCIQLIGLQNELEVIPFPYPKQTLASDSNKLIFVCIWLSWFSNH